MLIKETSFIEETIRILESLSHSTAGHTQEELEKIMIKKGYKKGYNTWITPGDIVPDED